MPAAKVQFDGLKLLRKQLRAAGDKQALNAVKEAHRTSAELVVKAALPNVPVRSGALKASVKALASQASGRVKAGTRVRVPYAAPIHWGWPGHNIERNPFLLNALESVRGEVDSTFIRALRSNVDIIDLVR